MRILHINTEADGGAFRAMERLHHGLLAAGADSHCLLQTKGPNRLMHAGRGALALRLWSKLDRLPLRFYAGRAQEEFNLQWAPGGILKAIKTIKPDLVHLHWVHRSFMRIEDLRYIEKPIFWTLHDCWAITGGCHYPDTCQRYLDLCGHCPKLGSKYNWDLSRWVMNRKITAWQDLKITFISPSRWLAELALPSQLLDKNKVNVIPNGLNLDAYKPINQKIAREILGINPETHLLLFGAMTVQDKRKGFHLINSAINEISQHVRKSSFELLIIGSNTSEEPLNIDSPIRYLGRLHDDVALRLAFCAADVTVVPSLQDNLPQMAVESMACGTPVVAFNATGLKDIVDHGINGYLAPPYDAKELGQCIASVLNHPNPQTLRQAAREKAVREYDIKTMVDRYQRLYASLNT